MEILGIDIPTAIALSAIVVGIVQWIKAPVENAWIVRLVSLAVSFALVALVTDWTAVFDWQIFIRTGFAVFAVANGIWHTADTIGRSTNRT